MTAKKTAKGKSAMAAKKTAKGECAMKAKKAEKREATMKVCSRDNARENFRTSRILAKGIEMNNDSYETQLNNNDLIIGPSGAGKTRGYVLPNVLLGNESMVVSAPKGNLYKKTKAELEAKGYEVINVDISKGTSTHGYNPLKLIRHDEETGLYDEDDIMRVAQVIVPDGNDKDPFWDIAARGFVACGIALLLERFSEEKHVLSELAEVIPLMKVNDNGSREIEGYIREAEEANPDSVAAKFYRVQVESCGRAEKMTDSIVGIAGTALRSFTTKNLCRMYEKRPLVDFRQLGRRKTAIFLSVSDTDRSKDAVASLFFTQLLQELCDSADNDYESCHLDIPTRIFLDDFATSVFIPDFDKTISMIREREIYVSVILQSHSQLTALYGEAKAATIVNNCDNWLYLGGQDIVTVHLVSRRAGKTEDTIMNMPLDKMYLFTRGQKARCLTKAAATGVETDGQSSL